MILNPSAVAAGRDVLLTQKEFFASVCEKGFVQTESALARLAPTMNGIFTRTAAQQSEVFFKTFLETAADYIPSGTSALETSAASAGESLAASAARNAALELAGTSGATLAGTGGTLTRTILEAGARGVILGLVIAATQWSFKRVARWRAEISIARAHTAVAATLTAAILDAFRASDPKTNPWPAPWPKPGTKAGPESEETRRRKRNGGKRYLRMAATRRK